ncbi:phage tail assembly chaperone [Glycocaulis sp.]|uniref:phage tail assembly chaperone n=1 Tax=Glycocaulis sp. TaxID=1969725 RepID=UPI003D1AA69F
MSAHWAACLNFAVLRLGLAPHAFWALSLGEWRALTQHVTGVSDLPDPAALRALAARFPD